MRTEIHPAVIAAVATLFVGLLAFLFYRSGTAGTPRRSPEELRQRLPSPKIPPLEAPR